MQPHVLATCTKSILVSPPHPLTTMLIIQCLKGCLRISAPSPLPLPSSHQPQGGQDKGLHVSHRQAVVLWRHSFIAVGVVSDAGSSLIVDVDYWSTTPVIPPSLPMRRLSWSLKVHKHSPILSAYAVVYCKFISIFHPSFYNPLVSWLPSSLLPLP